MQDCSNSAAARFYDYEHLCFERTSSIMIRVWCEHSISGRVFDTLTTFVQRERGEYGDVLCRSVLRRCFHHTHHVDDLHPAADAAEYRVLTWNINIMRVGKQNYILFACTGDMGLGEYTLPHAQFPKIFKIIIFFLNSCRIQNISLSTSIIESEGQMLDPSLVIWVEVHMKQCCFFSDLF